MHIGGCGFANLEIYSQQSLLHVVGTKFFITKYAHKTWDVYMYVNIKTHAYAKKYGMLHTKSLLYIYPHIIHVYIHKIYIISILNKVLTSTFIPHILWATSTLKDYSKHTHLHIAVTMTAPKTYVAI